MAIFNEDWTADVVGKMHKYRITNAELADACAEYTDSGDKVTNKEKPGFSVPYLSQILNGRKEFKSPEVKEATVERIRAALETLIERKQAAAKAVTGEDV